MVLLKIFAYLLPLLLLSACVTAPVIKFKPGATLETLSSAVSLSINTTDRSMSGSGFMVYRRPDQLHLVMLSPFGTTLLEAFALGERITLLYPSSSTAYTGRIADLPDKGGLQGWRMMRWVMDADPAASSSFNGIVERSGILGGKESVTYENGLVTVKSNPDGDKVYYSRHSAVSGVPFAAEVEVRNSRDDRIRIVLDEPEVNVPLDDAVFRPRLEGVTLLPLSELQGL